MIGVAAFWGTPFAPWHVLQTSNLAPRMASASAAIPGVATAGTSTTCSAAFDGAANAARTTRTAKTVGTRLLFMFALPLFECPRSRDATTAPEPPKHAAVRLVTQAAARQHRDGAVGLLVWVPACA